MKNMINFNEMTLAQLAEWLKVNGSRASEAQRELCIEIYMQKLTGEKKQKSQDILDSGLLYVGSFGSRRG